MRLSIARLFLIIAMVNFSLSARASDFSYSTPANEGISTKKIEDMAARAQQTDSSSFIIFKNRKIIFERYYPSQAFQEVHATTSADTIFNLYSITKSVASLLIGQLIHEGKIKSIDEPLTKWFPEWQHDSKKAKITLRMVLSHTTGLREPHGFKTEQNIIEHVRQLPCDFEPGTHFHYSSAITSLLSEIIRQANQGGKTEDYAQSVLFTPLDVKKENIRWAHDPSGNTITGYGIEMKTHDLLKIGGLLLNKGIRDQKQVIDPLWIEQLRRPSQKVKLDLSLLWWLFPGQKDSIAPIYSAIGMGGQYLIVVPEKDLVVLRTRKLPTTESPENFTKNSMNDLIELTSHLDE